MTASGHGSRENEATRWHDAAKSSTIQLLVADAGNRRAIRGILSDHFDVETSQTVTGADLYLIEDHLLPRYEDALREQIERRLPEFCPVVMLRRQTTPIERAMPTGDSSRALLIDEYVDTPVDRQLLLRRAHSLLIRREQSVELLTQVSRLEDQERDLRRFSRAVEGSGNAILILDTDGVIEYANPAFEELTGYDAAEAIGRTPEMLQTDDSGEFFDSAFWRTMADRTEWEGELVVQGANSRRVTDTSVTGIRDDRGIIEGFVAVMTDITQRIQREQALRDRESELELLRQILSRYLRHNLRNDLNVIQGYAELLKPNLAADETAYVTKIIETSNRLIQTADAAQKYSTFIEKGGELESYDLSGMVEEIAAELQAEHPTISIDVSCDDGCRVLGRLGIREAITGLIENAAVHHDADEPWIRIEVREHDGVRLTIEDNGPGIPPEELAVLERGEETPLVHSSGIGLWLSKLVIEEIDGELSFETEPGAGTRITVEFPARESVGVADASRMPDLKARERRLQTIIDRMTDAVVKVDASWIITFVSEQAEEILDVDAASLRGRNLWDAFPGARATRFEEVYRDAMRSRSSRRLEERFEGAEIWLEVYVYPDFDGGLSFYFRDATDRHRREETLEKERSRMELALGETNAVVFEIDLDSGRVTRYGEFRTWFDIPPEEVSTWQAHLERVVHPGDRDAYREFYQGIITGEREEGTIEYRTSPEVGDVRWIQDTVTIERDDEGPPRQALGLARDITADKARERELRERVKELTAIQQATQTFETSEARIGELLADFVEDIPDMFQYPAATAARITHAGRDVSTEGFDPAAPSLSAAAETGDGIRLAIEVVYMEEKPPEDIGPFLEEEQALVETLLALVKGYVERITYQRELERIRDVFTEAERQADLGVWEIDRDGELWISDGTRRIHELDEDVDHTVSQAIEFYHPDDRELVRAAVKAAVEEGERFDFHARLITADGNERWVRSRGGPVGESETVRGYIQDLTELRDDVPDADDSS